MLALRLPLPGPRLLVTRRADGVRLRAGSGPLTRIIQGCLWQALRQALLSESVMIRFCALASATLAAYVEPAARPRHNRGNPGHVEAWPDPGLALSCAGK